MRHPPRGILTVTSLLTHRSSAHAGEAPWEGKNALDAAFLAYANISALRQQIRPDERVHGIMEGKNWAPNGVFGDPQTQIFRLLLIVIPDNAKLRFITRAPTRNDVAELRKRVKACFELVTFSPLHVKGGYSSDCFSAAALATGCKHHVKLDHAYDDLIQNSVLGIVQQREFEPEG